MRIEYFEINDNNIIYRKYIDTDDKNYVSHTNDDVTFLEKDCVPYEKPEKITKSRNYESVRQELIKAYNKAIKDLQVELSVFKSAGNYDQYKELLYVNK